jgi:phage protein D
MQPAFDRTDWSVLSTLLRLAQRDGWRVEFTPERILVSSRRAAEGVVMLPATLVRHARASGWQTAIQAGEIALRHPAVRQSVTLRLGSRWPS